MNAIKQNFHLTETAEQTISINATFIIFQNICWVTVLRVLRPHLLVCAISFHDQDRALLTVSFISHVMVLLIYLIYAHNDIKWTLENVLEEIGVWDGTNRK